MKTVPLARCWVCDGLPLSMGLCLVCRGTNARCRVCHGMQVMDGLCPSCYGSRVSPALRRDDPTWHDPFVCPLCQGDPELKERCNLCDKHSGRLFINHREAEYIESLCQCACVDASSRYDPILGAVPVCPICNGFGVISLARRIYFDIQMTRHFIITPPRDLYYAALLRAWREISYAAPPQWPWERVAVLPGGAA